MVFYRQTLLDWLTTSLRREGALSGISATVEQLPFALATALLGVWLHVIHYVPQLDPANDSQPASAITALHYCQPFFPAALIYNLDEKRLMELRDQRSVSAALSQ